MNHQSIIQVHAGHTDIDPVPQWVGTVDAFWAANDCLCFGNICRMLTNLQYFGYHYIGGGASPCYTICTPDYAKRL